MQIMNSMLVRLDGRDISQLPLRSLNNDLESYVIFVNRTERTVNLIWFDYKGIRVDCGKIRPGRYRRVETSVTHPWTALDSVTSFTLLINGLRIFYPREQLNDVHFDYQNRDIVTIPYKLYHYISLPVFTLLQRCVEVVYCHYDKEKLQTMDLQQELRRTLSNVTGPSFYNLYQMGYPQPIYDDVGDMEEYDELIGFPFQKQGGCIARARRWLADLQIEERIYVLCALLTACKTDDDFLFDE